MKGPELNLNEKETKKPSIKDIPPQPETHKQSMTGIAPLVQKEKKESISKIDISNDSKHVSQESDNQKKDVSDTSLGQEMENKEAKPKFERMAIRKKTQKSTPSHSDATSDDMEKSIPNFIKKVDGGGDESEEKKEAASTNKGPQSLSDKLKMRANKLKKNKN